MNILLRVLCVAIIFFVCSKAGAQISIINGQVSGIKVMPDTTAFIFDSETQTITGYNGLVNGHLVVPQKIAGVQVLHIGDIAFYANGVTSVDLPDGLLSIGKHAFTYIIGSYYMTSVTLPASVSFVDNDAFFNQVITEITIGAGVTIATFSSMGSFGAEFKDAYDVGGKLAGTYLYDGGQWIKQ